MNKVFEGKFLNKTILNLTGWGIVDTDWEVIIPYHVNERQWKENQQSKKHHIYDIQ